MSTIIKNENYFVKIDYLYLPLKNSREKQIRNTHHSLRLPQVIEHSNQYREYVDRFGLVRSSSA